MEGRQRQNRKKREMKLNVDKRGPAELRAGGHLSPTFWKPTVTGASSKSTQLISRGSNLAIWCPRT